MWADQRVRCCSVATLAVGLVGAALLCLSFASAQWLEYPAGHYLVVTHSLHMGLWTDRACGPDGCGTVPSSAQRQDQSADWDMVLGLMCATISLVFIGVSLNIVMLISPRKTYGILTGFFWLLAAAANMVSVIIFCYHFPAYSDYGSWSYWVAILSTIVFFAVGLTISVFTCRYRWASHASRSGPEDPVTVAPPPVVSYRSEATTADGKPYDFSSDPDMQPYSFGGKAYDSGRNEQATAQSYHM